MGEKIAKISLLYSSVQIVTFSAGNKKKLFDINNNLLLLFGNHNWKIKIPVTHWPKGREWWSNPLFEHNHWDFSWQRLFVSKINFNEARKKDEPLSIEWNVVSDAGATLVGTLPAKNRVGQSNKFLNVKLGTNFRVCSPILQADVSQATFFATILIGLAQLFKQ